MRLEIEIDGQVIETEFSVTNGAARLIHDGKTYEAGVSEPEPGIFVVVFNNRVYRCLIEKLPNGETEVIVNNRRISATARDKKHLRGKTGAAAGSDGRVTLNSPMPGKVVRVLLNAGDEVAAQQGVLVVEAMKMQNEVQSPKAGKIAEIRVNEGQAVNAGEALAVIE
jgi:biotin carboxyl carrier protein